MESLESKFCTHWTFLISTAFPADRLARSLIIVIKNLYVANLLDFKIRGISHSVDKNITLWHCRPNHSRTLFIILLLDRNDLESNMEQKGRSHAISLRSRAKPIKIQDKTTLLFESLPLIFYFCLFLPRSLLFLKPAPSSILEPKAKKFKEI